MAAVSTKAIRRGLYSALTGASSITDLVGQRVFHQKAPKDTQLPFIVFFKQSGTPTYAFGATAFDTQSWVVKAVDRDESSDRAEDIAAAVDALLTNGSLTLQSGSLMDLRRQSDIDYLEDDEGVQYRHHGASYRVVAQ